MIQELISRQQAVIGAEDYWAGETFRDKIEGISATEAFIQPLPGMHSIAEQISHVLEWRKDNIRKLNGKRPLLLSLDAPENWIPNKRLEKKGWETLKKEFYAGVEELCGLLREQNDKLLEQQPKGEKHTYLTILDGLINHDIYHLGQIGLTIKLVRMGYDSRT